MIEAILNLSAMRFNEAEPDIAEFNIAKLLDRFRDQFTGQAVNKGPKLCVVPCKLRIRSNPILLFRDFTKFDPRDKPEGARALCVGE